LFAVALLASSELPRSPGTLAGRSVMEGFLNIRLARGCAASHDSIAIVPAVSHGFLRRERHGAAHRPSAGRAQPATFFAVIPLILFTMSRRKMASSCNPRGEVCLSDSRVIVI